MSGLDWAVLVGYFAAMAVIGLLCMLRVKVQADYFMGGRKFGKILQTFAAFGAGTGSSDPVNIGTKTYTSGLSGIWSVLYWLFVTPFYWITGVWYRRMRCLTLGDWFAERYQSTSLGAAYAVFGLLFYMVYGSMMFSAIGKVAAPLLGTGTFEWFGRQLGIEYLLVPVIGVVVLVYGIAGGLKAAYWTDLIQGLFILLLSIILIPYGLKALVVKFGDPATQGWLEGFGLMHRQLPAEQFELVGTTSASEFPLHRIVAIVLINLVGVAVHPHFITTGGGSAKTEMSARVGLVAGNFLKRLCTVGWAITALIVLALFADSIELAEDPDRVWGVAAREILGPLKLGLVGLMLACLLAALMSSVDAYMVVGSALVVRNIYAPYFHPDASDRHYLTIARFTGVLIVGGAVVISLSIMDVFEQLQLTWYVPVLFGAPFWVGILWRRASGAAAWLTVLFSAAVFFVIPQLAPDVAPQLREDPRYTVTNEMARITTTTLAAPTDVARRQAATELWEQRRAAIDEGDPATRADRRAQLGPRPEPLELGDPVTRVSTTGGQAIFWSGGVVAVDEQGRELPELRPLPAAEPARLDEHTVREVLRYPEDTRLEGRGRFQLDLLVYEWAGIDLTHRSDAMLDTLTLPVKTIAPFLVLILLSWITPRPRREGLDRYFVKMKTPVQPDPERDQEELELSYARPDRFDHLKMFPRSSLEMMKPDRVDVIGVLVCFALCFAIIALAVFLARLGG